MTKRESATRRQQGRGDTVRTTVLRTPTDRSVREAIAISLQRFQALEKFVRDLHALLAHEPDEVSDEGL